jgi:hypothetical protein
MEAASASGGRNATIVLPRQAQELPQRSTGRSVDGFKLGNMSGSGAVVAVTKRDMCSGKDR